MRTTADLYHRRGQPGDEGRHDNEVTIREALARGFASDLDRSRRLVNLTDPIQAIDTGGMPGFIAGPAEQQGVPAANLDVQGLGENKNVSMQEDDYDELYDVTPPGQAHPVSRPLQPLLAVLSPHTGRGGSSGLNYASQSPPGQWQSLFRSPINDDIPYIPGLTPLPGQSSSTGSAQIGDNRDRTQSSQDYSAAGLPKINPVPAMPVGAIAGDGAHTQPAGLSRPMGDYQLQLLTALGSERYAPMMEGNIDAIAQAKRKLETELGRSGVDPWNNKWQRCRMKDSDSSILVMIQSGGLAWMDTDQTSNPRSSQILARLRSALGTIVVGEQRDHQASFLQPHELSTATYSEGGYFARRIVQSNTFPRRDAQGRAHHNQRSEATGATYEALVSVTDGVIIAGSWNSPAQALAAKGSLSGELPVLQSWSDVTYYMWARFHAVFANGGQNHYIDSAAANRLGFTGSALYNQSMAWLNMIIFPDIDDPTTLEVVGLCLQSRGKYTSVTVPEWTERETFPIGHWCAYALMTSKPSNNVVEFLAFHKTKLGDKIMSTVTIWYPGPSKLPALLWQISDDIPAVKKLAESYMIRWEKAGDATNMKFPPIQAKIPYHGGSGP
ncbi:hypothetical protein LTR86_005120 [Recurvomyces mirabilis]|nr:hypothetical protein LTR86_005120 [Recurvomyces mirabilis]